MKKLLFVNNSLRILGGVERALINLLHALPKERYQIDLLMFDDVGIIFEQIPEHVNILPPLRQFTKWSPELIQWFHDNDKLHMLKVKEQVHIWNTSGINKGKSPGEIHNRNWNKLKTICPEYKGYDVAIAFIDTIILKIVAEKVSSKKKIAWAHLDFNYQKISTESQEPFFSKMDTIVCVTEQNAQVLSQLIPKLSSKIIVLPNVNNSNEINRLSKEFLPKEYANDKYNIFTAARLCEQKGIDFIIEAARIIRDSGVAFRWIIAGEKQKDWEQYQKMVEENELQDMIYFPGTLLNPYPYFYHCDLYVQPSRYEGKSVAIEEAKILGCPIIATNFSSIGDSITNGINGVICNMNPEGLSQAVITLLKDEQLRKNLSISLSSFEYDNSINKYLELFG